MGHSVCFSVVIDIGSPLLFIIKSVSKNNWSNIPEKKLKHKNLLKLKHTHTHTHTHTPNLALKMFKNTVAGCILPVL